MRLNIQFKDNSNNESSFKIYRATDLSLTDKVEIISLSYSYGWTLSGSNNPILKSSNSAPSQTGETFSIDFDEDETGSFFYGVGAFNSAGGGSSIEATLSSIQVGETTTLEPTTLAPTTLEPTTLEPTTTIESEFTQTFCMSYGGTKRTYEMQTDGNYLHTASNYSTPQNIQGFPVWKTADNWWIFVRIFTFSNGTYRLSWQGSQGYDPRTGSGSTTTLSHEQSSIDSFGDLIKTNDLFSPSSVSYVLHGSGECSTTTLDLS